MHVWRYPPYRYSSLGHERPFSLASKTSAHLRTSGSCKSLQRPDPTGPLYPFVLQRERTPRISQEPDFTA